MRKRGMQLEGLELLDSLHFALKLPYEFGKTFDENGTVGLK